MCWPRRGTKSVVSVIQESSVLSQGAPAWQPDNDLASLLGLQFVVAWCISEGFLNTTLFKFATLVSEQICFFLNSLPHLNGGKYNWNDVFLRKWAFGRELFPYALSWHSFQYNIRGIGFLAGEKIWLVLGFWFGFGFCTTFLSNRIVKRCQVDQFCKRARHSSSE